MLGGVLAQKPMASVDPGLMNLQRFAAPDGVRITASPDEARRLYENPATPEEQKIKETATEFVSILFSMVFKEMDKTVERTGFLDGGKYEEMFRSQILDEHAKRASGQQGNELAHRVYEMLRHAAVRPPADGATAPKGLDLVG
jgi:Rod binding domain-containing protein